MIRLKKDSGVRLEVVGRMPEKNIREEEEEEVVLERNIMDDGPESRLPRPENIEADLWTEVVRLNSYIGKGTYV